MNNEEAKFILHGYRPNGADAGDATFCAAVDQAKRDPALGEWFAGQQAFDTAVSAKLAQVAPPPGLRAAILAGGAVTEPARPAPRWWNRPVWVGLAACIALVFTAGVALWPSRAEALTDFVLDDMRAPAGHEGHGPGSSVLQAVFSSPDARLGQALALDFAQLHETGCRTLLCQGNHVLEACFNRDGKWFHVYVVRRTDFPSEVRNNLKISDHGQMSLATWADDDYVYLVVSRNGRQNLELLL